MGVIAELFAWVMLWAAEFAESGLIRSEKASICYGAVVTH